MIAEHNERNGRGKSKRARSYRDRGPSGLTSKRIFERCHVALARLAAFAGFCALGRE